MNKKTLNLGWRFCELEEGQDAFGGPPQMIDVDLPHDAMIARNRKPGIPGGPAAGQYENKNMLYEKRFSVSEDPQEQKYYLEFEGVYANATVFLNGNYLGGCHYGYSDFLVDATEAIVKGRENLLQVYTKTGMGMLTRWYTGDGIYRPVWLHTGQGAGFVPNSARTATEKLEGTTAAVSVRGKVYGKPERLTVRAEILDAEGTVAAQSDAIAVCADGSYAAELPVNGAKLWSAETPELYSLRLTLRDGEKTADTDELRFGIRTITVRAGEGLLINGKPVKLRGGCIHHDNGIIGAMEFDDAARRRIQILKEAGFNAVRSAHNPISVSLLRACDELGMYVMEESFDTWAQPKTEYDFSLFFDDCWRTELTRLVEKDFSHPSVILYAIGNEIQYLNRPAGVKTNRELAEFVRSLDPTRPVTNAVNGMFIAMAHMGEILHDVLGDEGGGGDGPLEINQVMTALDTHMDEIMRHRYITEMLDGICGDLDLIGYNYMGGRYEGDTAAYPNRVIVGSETRPDTIAENWERVKKLDNVVGDFVWTAWDYIGESGVGRVDFDEPFGPMYGNYPWYIAYAGDIDICGNRRPASYYRQIVWGLGKKPYIAVWRPQNIGKPAHTSNWSWSDSVRCWTWPGFEGKPTVAEIYSDADEVELLLNGKSLGRKKVGEEKPCIVRFPICYEPGELKAVAWSSGQPVSEDVLRTAGENRMLNISLSEAEVRACREKLIFADISVEDGFGIVDMAAQRKVRLTVEGPVELIGFGSADPKSTENFFETVRTTYDGRLLAALRPCGESGEALLIAESEGLSPVKSIIKLI